MTDQEIAIVASEVLRKLVPSANLQALEVKSETDFDGGPILRITAHYEKPPKARDELIRAVHPLRSALVERGEDRFIILANDVASERQLEPDLD